MIHGNQSISHYTRSNIAIWMSLAFQAGLLNIGGFLACHRFVSHVTGFAAYFGLEASRGNGNEAAKMLLVPLFFLAGSLISGFLVDLRLKLHKKPKYYLSFGIIFFVLLAVSVGGTLGFFGTFGEPVETVNDYVLLALLCLVCGLMNGTVTTVSRSIVRTTHLTGITTDLGIGIVRYLYREKIHHEIPNEGRANLMRLGIILSFGMGSLLGAVVFERFGYAGFFLPALSSGALFALMLSFHLRGAAAAPQG